MATIDKIRLSGTTYDLIDSTAIHSLDGYWTTAETENAITAATSALAETIEEQHYATESYVQSAITEVSGITSGEVQSMIDESVSGKADTTAVTEAISEATSGKANSSDAIKTIVPQVYTAEQAEIGEMNLKLTKADGTNSVLTQFIGAGSGITITKNIYNGADLSVDTTVIAQKSDIPSVSGYADAVKYNSTSKYVEFYHGGTGGTKVFEYDASPFLIDGMVQNVEIKDVSSGGTDVTCLVISFNTDAGKQDINIPISEIFDASNYYTKTDTDTKISEATSGKVDTSTYTAYTAATDTTLGGKADTTAVTQAISEATSGKADTTAVTQAISEAVSGKADTTAVTQSINEAVSGKVDSSTYTAYTATTDTALAGKQETLVSGTNIKTINNTTILGAGNISTLQVEVSGTTLIFS